MVLRWHRAWSQDSNCTSDRWSCDVMARVFIAGSRIHSSHRNAVRDGDARRLTVQDCR
jgi:hypothetical protein